jgi:hypothetical protein
MEETVGAQQLSSRTDSKQRHAHALVLQTILLLGEAVALVWLIARLASADWIEALCLGQFMIVLAIASASMYCTGVRRRRLYDPLRRLEVLMPEVRSGQAPIEELSQIQGQIAPLALQIQELLRENRTQKRAA